MISKQERAQIQLLSDTELYRQAIEFMQSIGNNTLSSSQVNGLLNVSLTGTYSELNMFIKRQQERTWKHNQQYIPDFYKKLTQKLPVLEEYEPTIAGHGQEKRSYAEKTALHMALAREFIQHILAENAYKSAQKEATPNNQHNDREPRQPQTREGHRQ